MNLPKIILFSLTIRQHNALRKSILESVDINNVQDISKIVVSFQNATEWMTFDHLKCHFLADIPSKSHVKFVESLNFLCNFSLSSLENLIENLIRNHLRDAFGSKLNVLMKENDEDQSHDLESILNLFFDDDDFNDDFEKSDGSESNLSTDQITPKFTDLGSLAVDTNHLGFFKDLDTEVTKSLSDISFAPLFELGALNSESYVYEVSTPTTHSSTRSSEAQAARVTKRCRVDEILFKLISFNA